MKRILVIGRGTIGKALAEHDPDYHLASVGDFRSCKYVAGNWLGVVNAAGIVGAGACYKHSWQEVMKANVELPMKIKKACDYFNVPSVMLSSIGIYKRQVSENADWYDHEFSEVYPHNPYVASKLLMEHVIASGGSGLKSTSIFRIPFFDDTEQWYNRVVNWKEVQSTHTSMVSVETLSKAIKKVFQAAHKLNGLYNIATEVRYLPHFIDVLRMRTSDKDVEIPQLHHRSEYPPDMTAAIPVSCELAKQKGIL